MRIGFVDSGSDKLGESCIWDDAAGALFWVDIMAPRIRRYVPATGQVTDWPTPDLVGSIGLTDGATLVAALRDGFYRFDLASGQATPIRAFPRDETVRFNDGKADRQGRFLAGAMMMDHAAPPAGKLHRLDRDGNSVVLESDLAVSNALCFSPAGDRMYFADSLQHAIWTYDYDPADGGTATNRRVLVDMRAHGSAPDGATVDAEGCIWVAMVQSGHVARFRPDGALERKIATPMPFPTCPAFGGERLDTLFVTSISDSGGRLRSDDPNAGRLAIIEGLDAVGLPEARYRPRTA